MNPDYTGEALLLDVVSILLSLSVATGNGGGGGGSDKGHPPAHE